MRHAPGGLVSDGALGSSSANRRLGCTAETTAFADSLAPATAPAACRFSPMISPTGRSSRISTPSSRGLDRLRLIAPMAAMAWPGALDAGRLAEDVWEEDIGAAGE